MGFLKIAGTNFRGRNVRGDDKHRHPRAVAVEQAIDEVQIAGSATAGADRKFIGQMRLGAGREGRDLFAAHMHLFDLALTS
jgi:hypothetical protein